MMTVDKIIVKDYYIYIILKISMVFKIVYFPVINKKRFLIHYSSFHLYRIKSKQLDSLGIANA